MSIRALTVLLAVAVCLVLAAGGSARPERPAALPPKWLTGATAKLDGLRTKAWSTVKYDRARFGPKWPDVDGNGCDTRNDILRRDLKDEVFQRGSTCKVQRGRLNDPYTGKLILFERGKKSTPVDIDHVVSLGNAWRTGALGWTDQRRRRYANDPVVLLAVDGPANRAKGERDASQWLPTRLGYRCRFVAKQITIKAKYALWVTPAERTRMTSLLANCPR